MGNSNKSITQIDLASIVRWTKWLIDKGEISRTEAEITLSRIVKNNNLIPIYF